MDIEAARALSSRLVIGAVLEPEDYRAIPQTIDALVAEAERLREALAAAKAVQDWHALAGEPDGRPQFDPALCMAHSEGLWCCLDVENPRGAALSVALDIK